MRRLVKKGKRREKKAQPTVDSLLAFLSSELQSRLMGQSLPIMRVKAKAPIDISPESGSSVLIRVSLPLASLR